MGSHVIDLMMLQNNFGTEKMRKVFDDDARIAAQLKAEGALALAEGELGLIPQDAAKKIADAASMPELFDIRAIAAAAAAAKHTMVGTIKALQKLSGDAGEYVHYGATTQDIVDTGMMLQLKDAYHIILADVDESIRVIAGIASEYRDLPMAGRTHAVHALPITFGFKAAIWLDEFLRHRERLREMKERVFAGSMSGAVGTGAAFGPLAVEVERRTMEHLGLSAPHISWQPARDRLAEFGSVLASVSVTSGKIGNELYNLSRTEIGEIEEPFSSGKIGSSTMPHKRNPAAIEGLASLTPAVIQNLALLYQSGHMEHERDAMSWRLEWIALPEICIYVSCQLSSLQAILSGMTVRADRMEKNLDLQKGLLLSENAMFEIGKKFGKQTAHEMVYEACMKAYEEDRPLAEVLMENPEIGAAYTCEEINSWLVPEAYLGAAGERVDIVLAAAGKSDAGGVAEAGKKAGL